jgi:hypothetical protein
MAASLSDICCASFPAKFLAALADVRCVPGVRVALTSERTWLRWDNADERVLRAVLPIPGVKLYVQRDGNWFRHGHHLLALEVLADLVYRPLHEVLTPAPVLPLPPPTWEGRPMGLTLVPDGEPHATTALMCNREALLTWADGVPAARLVELHAAHRGEQVLLLGGRQPLLPVGERFWGERVLVPIGFRLEPRLTEGVVCQALGLIEDQLLLMRAENSEILFRSSFQPLTRAGLRLACLEAQR